MKVTPSSLNSKNMNRRSTTLALVVLVIFVLMIGARVKTQSGVGGETGSLRKQNRVLSQEKPDKGASLSWMSDSDSTRVSSDGWATSQTGVYYVPGDESKCFMITATPHGLQAGWILEPSDALSATMISGFGYVQQQSPFRGKVSVWSWPSRHQYKETTFSFYGGSIIIDGVTYWRRPPKASWTCKTGFTVKTAYYAKAFGAQKCQWLKSNPKTGGFVIYYSPGSGALIAAGGGFFYPSTNHVLGGSGVVAGYHQKDGWRDGPYDVHPHSNPTALWLFKNGVHFEGGKYDFIQLSTCVDPGYPKITQEVVPPNSFSGSYFSKCSPQVRSIFGSGWTLVRRVGPSHKVWHPTKDQLTGTAVYGTPATDVADATFSVHFASASYNQFLFTTGDCANWVLTSRTSVVGGWYSNAPRQACATSLSPFYLSNPRWFHRDKFLEDPWVSVVDHFSAINLGLIVYGENNWGLPQAKEIVPRNGANVYIRSKCHVDASGC